MDSLSPEHAEVLVLAELEERSAAEVAALVAVPVGTVKSRLRLAKEAFRRAALDRGVVVDAEGEE